MTDSDSDIAAVFGVSALLLAAFVALAFMYAFGLLAG